MFRPCLFDFRTGGPLMALPASAASWSSKLAGSGQGSVTFPLRSLGVGKETVRDLLQPNRRLVAMLADDGTVAAAGFIIRNAYDRMSGKVTSSWVDVRDIFRGRLGYGVHAWNDTGTLTVSGRSLSGAARAIIARAMVSEEFELPIDLPADGAGSFTRAWPFYAFATSDDKLRELEDEGAEIWFEPYLTSAGALRFQTRVGAPYATGWFDLPVTVDRSQVTDLTVTEDAAQQVTGVIFAGNGTDRNQITAWAGSGSAGAGGIVIRDVYQSQKDIKSQVQLQRIAAAYLAAHNAPTTQWAFNVQLSDEVPLSVLKPGRRLRMDVSGDDWIPDALYPQRVIGISGDMTAKVKVEVQEHGG